MTDRMYRLLERLQKLDARLNRARTQRQADPLEIAWLSRRRIAVRTRLARLSASLQWAPLPVR